MSAIAGQTAGQIGLKLFQETQGYFFQLKKNSWATPGISASMN